MKLFGFEIKRSSDEDKQTLSFADPENTDGALNVGTALGGTYGMLIDLEGSAKTEAELVGRYRQMALTPEIQQAVEEITNEAICIDTDEKVIKVVLDDVKIPEKVKEKIQDEFDNILTLLDFSNNGYEIFSKFYVDGRLNYHIIIDEKNLKSGIKELRYVDPRKLRLIRELETVKDTQQNTSAALKRVRKEYYMYSDGGYTSTTNQISSPVTTGIRISKDSIARVTSGILNENNAIVLSYLHKAIRPLNQLKMLEDATVIYTLTRAPERRVFYVDVGNLPKAKAEQHLLDMMARHKNKVVYDPTTGEMRDDRRMMTMTEDYWFPRREGNRSTEVDTLPSSGSLTDNDSLNYFQTKLFKALGVPLARLQPETMYTFGRTSEVTREELKFGKFVRRLRARFSILFDICLEKQLILKGIITPDEWQQIKNDIRYDYVKDNFFEELKETEIIREKISTLRDIQEHAGIYFSRNWIRKKVLFMNDEEIKEMDKEIEQEKKAGVYGDEPETDQENIPPEQDQDQQPEEQPRESNVITETNQIINRSKNKRRFI